jgi:hypothetical protein
MFSVYEKKIQSMTILVSAKLWTWTFCFQIPLTSNAQIVFITCWCGTWKMIKQHKYP